MAYRGNVLTIAGSDSGGGAGIQADLKTFAALNVFGMSVVTALTAQNSLGVVDIMGATPEIVRLQMKAVFEDFRVDAVKTGMLANPAIVEIVAGEVAFYGVDRLVLDPVMVSQSGSRLIADEAVSVLAEKLIPKALLVTPNVPEAEVLSGLAIRDLSGMKEAARKIASLGCRGVLVKGGHLIEGDVVRDVLFWDGETTVFEDEKIQTEDTHGTGCTLSSAIAAELAAGRGLLEAVDYGRRYLRLALARSFRPGRSHGPLGHALPVPWAGV